MRSSFRCSAFVKLHTTMTSGALQRTLYRSLLRWPGKIGSGKEKLPIQLR